VETAVLLRHGFARWEDVWPRRQRVVVEAALDAVDGASRSAAVRRALRLAVVGATEMAGHLSRWDRYYLKAYEGMAGHRFNVTTLAVEPHGWGRREAGRGTIARRLDQLVRASTWLNERAPTRCARVRRGSSSRIRLDDESVDLCLTDPPYDDDVQYDELAAPFRAWLALKSAGAAAAVGGRARPAGAYRRRLTAVLREVRRVLRPSGHLVFSFANRRPQAWADVLEALQDAGFVGVGYAIVHSENERDGAKRGVRACALDLLIDVVPASGGRQRRFAPPRDDGASEEEAFLSLCGDFVLDVGRLEGDWRERVVAGLAAHPFLS
jgi:adenine-specific DNA methylase